MIRIRNKIIGSLASALIVVAAVAPGAGAADDPSSPGASARTATELGQAIGEPGADNGAFVRTATELGQAVGEPADGILARAVEAADEELSSPAGFNWGDAALGAGVALALAALGGAAFLTVRRRTAVSHSAASAS